MSVATDWKLPTLVMQTYGTRNDWLYIGYIKTELNSAYCEPKAGEETNQLWAMQFRFGIPTAARIDGIEVQINRLAGGENESSDSVVQLMRTDVGLNDVQYAPPLETATLLGSNQASGAAYPMELVTASYGGGTDRWGSAVSFADINANDFGLCYSFLNIGSSSSSSVRRVNVSYIKMRVWYTLADWFRYDVAPVMKVASR